MIFTDAEIKILAKYNIPPDVTLWSDDDYVHAEDVVGDEWTAEVQRAGMKETDYGKICQQLIDKITSM